LGLIRQAQARLKSRIGASRLPVAGQQTVYPAAFFVSLLSAVVGSIIPVTASEPVCGEAATLSVLPDGRLISAR
jgi:hypothetical protein